MRAMTDMARSEYICNSHWLRVLFQTAVPATAPVLRSFQLPTQFPIEQVPASRASESVQPHARSDLAHEPSREKLNCKLIGHILSEPRKGLANDSDQR